MDGHGQVELSVVVPVYNCADCLEHLHDRLSRTLERSVQGYELVFIDDRSPDGSWDVLLELAARDPSVKLYRLSRNFGQAVAITAGIEHATGDWIVLMDCDLQDRPEDIPRLLERARSGYEIVFSRRANRRQTWFRRLGARLYFRLRNRLLGVAMEREHGSLMLMSRRVADEFLRIRDRDRHHALMLYWLGFEQEVVELEHGERHAGRSSYTFARLLQVAIDGLFFQTTVLLRWIVYVGLLIAVAGVLLAAFLVGFYFLADPYPGWTSLGVLILLLGGFIIFSVGVASMYVGKIFEQVKDRPLYVVDREVLGGDQQAEARTGERVAR